MKGNTMAGNYTLAQIVIPIRCFGQHTLDIRPCLVQTLTPFTSAAVSREGIPFLWRGTHSCQFPGDHHLCIPTGSASPLFSSNLTWVSNPITLSFPSSQSLLRQHPWPFSLLVLPVFSTTSFQSRMKQNPWPSFACILVLQINRGRDPQEFHATHRICLWRRLISSWTKKGKSEHIVGGSGNGSNEVSALLVQLKHDSSGPEGNLSDNPLKIIPLPDEKQLIFCELGSWVGYQSSCRANSSWGRIHGLTVKWYFCSFGFCIKPPITLVFKLCSRVMPNTCLLPPLGPACRLVYQIKEKQHL